MTCTWLVACLYLWDALFFPERLTFFQSKKENDADENMERAYRVWQNLPFWMREWAPVKRTFCRIEFKHNNSRIFGVPAGADHARQYTSSGYFSDEIAYQDEVDKVMAAVSPTLTGGGRFTGVSSATASYFSQLVRDEV